MMTDIPSLKIAGVLKNFPEPMFITDRDGFILFQNVAAVKATGYTKSEMLGLPIFRLISEEYKELLKEELIKVIAQESPSALGVDLTVKDGTKLNVNFTLSPITTDSDEGESEACLFFIKNFSPPTLSTTDESSIHFLIATLNVLKEGVVVTDLTGKISFANPMAESMFAYATDQLMGLNLKVLFPPIDKKNISGEIIEKTLSGQWEGELVATKKDDNKINVRLATIIIRDSHNNPSLIICVIQDISKEIELQRKLVHINKELTALYAVSTTLSESIEISELLNVSLSKVLEVMEMDKGIIRIVEEETGDLVLKAHVGVSIEYLRQHGRMPKEGSISGRVAKTGVPYLADRNIESDPERDVALIREGLHQTIIIPLRSKDKTLGTMSVGGYNPRTSTFQDIKLLTSIGNLFGVAIENALIFEKADMLSKEKAIKIVELTLLSDLSHALMTTIELDKLLYIVLTTVTMGESFGFNRAALFLVDENENSIVGRMGVGPINKEDAGRIWAELEKKRYKLQELVKNGFEEHGSPDSIQNRAIQKIQIPLSDVDDVLVRSITENRPIIVRNVKTNPHVSKKMTALLMGDEEFACVPIVVTDKPLGVLLVDNVFNRKPIVEEDTNLLWAFANQAGLAIQNSLLYTNLSKINLELRKAQAKLLQQAKLVGLGEMATEIAHEIRNPLVSVGGFARKLSKHAGDNKKLKQYSDIIVEEVNKLEHTLLNVLLLQQEIPPNFEEVDLNGIISDTLNLVKAELAPIGIELVINLEDSLPKIEADSAQLRQVFLNLTYNAIQAMEEGGKLGVTTSLEEASLEEANTKKYVKTVVEDTGVGVPEKLIEDIFKPFFTTKSTGTGLGLAITHKIITNHGGKIEILNKPEGGASFIVEIPVKQGSGD
jgi:PAS domain S-box-containing protein